MTQCGYDEYVCWTAQTGDDNSATTIRREMLDYLDARVVELGARGPEVHGELGGEIGHERAGGA